MSCANLCQSKKSILVGKNLKLPRNIALTDHYTDRIQLSVINGDGPALISAEGETLWTPKQLDDITNRVAKAIRRLLGFWTTSNTESDLVIGMCMHTNENAILIMLSILKLGGTFFYFPPTYPETQILRTVGNIRPIMIITENDPHIVSRFNCVKHICEIVPIFIIKEYSFEFAGDPNDPTPLESIIHISKRTACIMLTAGTIGPPRLVRIGHLAILNRIYWQYKAIPYREGEIASLVSPLTDVECLSEIFAPLLGGTPLYVIPRHCINNSVELMAKIEKVKISRITLTPSALKSLFDVMRQSEVEEAKERFNSLKFLGVSGDVLDLNTGIRCFDFMSSECKLVYFYGASETTSEATWELFTDKEDFKQKVYAGKISNGLPLANTTIYITDEDMNIVPKGTMGQVCVLGTSLALGYSNNKDIESSRFVQYPPKAKKSSRTLLRTGDFGRIVDSDGNHGARLYYEGRIDMIMKINGQEIELHTIGVAVHSTDLCKDCAVLCYHRDREDQAAVAFCILKENVDREMVLHTLNKILPDFMVPDVYPVTELPYLPSGRLDKQKLLKMYRFRRIECTPDDWKILELPLTEKLAARILLEAISHTIGIMLRYVMRNYNCSFWSIGGTSLNALVVVGICREKGYLISIDDFVLADTIAGIVTLMTQARRRPVPENLLLLNVRDLNHSLEKINSDNKTQVIELLSKCYAQKDPISVLAGLKQQDYEKYLEAVWDEIVKEDLSVLATDKFTGKIVAVALFRDINNKKFSASLKRLEKPISYYIELLDSCETMARRTTVGKDKGRTIQLFFIGTDTSVQPKYNIILVEYLMKGGLQRASSHGFSSALIMSANPLARDLCGNVLQEDLIADIKLNKFTAKDKTRPFRNAREYQLLRAYHCSFI